MRGKNMVREYGWEPELGDRVQYRHHADMVPEIGVVQEIRGQNAMVLYLGDRTAKSTRISDLEPAGVGIEGETLGFIPDPTPPNGMDWRDGLDALDALLNDCSQIGDDCENFVRVQAVRHIVNAVRRWEDDTDESIRSALWEDAVERGEEWTEVDR